MSRRRVKLFNKGGLIMENISEDQYKVTLKCPESFELTRPLSSFGGHISDIKPQGVYYSEQKVWKSGVDSI